MNLNYFLIGFEILVYDYPRCFRMSLQDLNVLSRIFISYDNNFDFSCHMELA
jgi:hypothetical protein